jgi:hypothetical protein
MPMRVWAVVTLVMLLSDEGRKKEETLPDSYKYYSNSVYIPMLDERCVTALQRYSVTALQRYSVTALQRYMQNFAGSINR